MGSVGEPRRRFGDLQYVQLLSRTAPRSTEAMRAGILKLFPDAETKDRTYHVRIRFSVPAAAARGTARPWMVAPSASSPSLWKTTGIHHCNRALKTLNDALIGHEEGYRGKDGSKKKNWSKMLLEL